MHGVAVWAAVSWAALYEPCAALLAWLIEIAQIRRLLILPDRHQEAICAQEIVLLADNHMLVVGGADVFAPSVVALATVAAGHRPGTRERIVDDGDLVAQHVRVGLVEADALLDDGALVRMERRAAAVVDMRIFQAASLGFQRVVAAVAILVDPF